MNLRLFALLFVFTCWLGIGPQAFSFEIPSLSGPVIDEVGLLNENTKSQLAQSLQRLNQEQRVQIQVYITKSLQGEEIESAAIKIFDQWKLGDEKTDKGLLFLIAPTEKRMRIEVGQGLEGDIPDVIAKRIISDVVKPYFQRKEFSLGVLQGVAAIQTYIGNPDARLNQEQLAAAEKSDKKSGGSWIIFLIVGIWILLFIFNPSLALYILFSMMRGGGGGGGGGSWSGGGGKSSGGGASGGW